MSADVGGRVAAEKHDVRLKLVVSEWPRIAENAALDNIRLIRESFGSSTER